MANVSIVRGWSTSTSESLARCEWAQTTDHFFERKDSLSKDRQGKIWESSLNSQLCCTRVGIELKFLHFLATQVTFFSPVCVYRLRCSVSVLLHIAFKCSNKGRVLGFQVMGIPVWHQLGSRDSRGTLLTWTEVEDKYFHWPRVGTALGDCVSEHLRIKKITWAGTQTSQRIRCPKRQCRKPVLQARICPDLSIRKS